MNAANVSRSACSYCGYLDWTVEKYGRVTHKQGCPMRTDPWHQGDPHADSAASEGAGSAYSRESRWQLSWRADPVANAVAKRHYNCQSPDSGQWVKPGACLCFRTIEGGAIWSTSAPLAEYVQHAWAGAWENSTFRNERRDLYLSSDLIREGVAATLWLWPTPPELGMVTMVDAGKTRRKRDPGRCYRRAGFEHVGFTQGGLWVFQMLPDAFPEPMAPLGEQLRMVAA